MRARRGLCGAARPRRVVKEPQFMNSEFTTQLWCLDALLSRGPGERPGRSRADILPAPAPHYRYGIRTSGSSRADMRTIRAARSSHTSRTPTRPVRLTAATGPVESPDRRPPRPAAIISRRSSDGVRRRPRQLVTRARHGHDRRRGHQRDSPRTERGYSRHHFPRPAPLPHSRRESDNHPLRSHFHSRLRSETSLFHPLASALSLTSTHPLSPLILTHTHHSLSLTHSNASTHSLTRIHSLSLTGGACRCATHCESLKGSLEIVID